MKRSPTLAVHSLVLAVLATVAVGAAAGSPAAADPGAQLGPAPARSAHVEARITATASSARAARPASGAIDTTDPGAVATAYRDVFLPSYGVSAPSRTDAQLAACDAGPQPDALQDAVLTQINYFRAMSQVEPVTLDPALSEKAQQAALMMAANGQLNHTPPSSWSCYSAVGAAAAGSSNLALGVRGSETVALYMNDPGGSNTAVGHRFWLQRPSATVMGSGSVGAANALYVTSGGTPRSTPTLVSWPSAGYFPASLDPSGRWSVFANGSTDLDLSQATVGVRGPDGTPLPVTTYPATNAYGTLVFQVGGRRTPASGAVDEYQVTVTGLKDGSGTLMPYVYDVLMFDASAPSPSSLVATSPATVSGTAAVGQVLTAHPPTWDVAGATNTYRWYAEGSDTLLGAGPTYTVQATDAGTQLVVEVSGDLPGRHGTARSAPTRQVPPNATTLTVSGSSTYPTAVELTAALSAPGIDPPDGTLTLSEGGRIVDTLDVVDGEASYYGSGFSGGAHDLTVSFAGDERLAPAQASVRVNVVDKVTPTLTLRPRSAAAKKARVDILVDADGYDPKGTATVSENGTTVKSGLSVSRPGKATWKASGLVPGSHTYVVAYSGTSRVKDASQEVTLFVQPKLKAYKTCAALNKDFPHGVGKVGAVDATTKTPVTTYLPHDKLYSYNDGKKTLHHGERDLDTDDDGIACEAG